MKKLIFTLFLASFLCVFANAQDNSKIDAELQKVLNQRSNDLIDIQIFFESSLDTRQLNQNTRQATTKSSKKDIVINELKKHSANVQADVLEILKAEEKSGNVSDIQRLWIANSISCKASKSVIYNLSSHPDIKILGYDKEIQMISPEQMKEASSTSNGKLRGPASHIYGVNADDVWAQGYTGKNVIVAVLDSGTNTSHNDLKDHLWKGYVDTDDDGTPDTYVNGWNFTEKNGGNSNVTDDYGHGTHCAGIVCGDGTSGNTTGIAPDALLMTLKTINRAGGGSVAQMLSGVQFAVENGADILSMSLGFKNSQLTATQKETIRSTFNNVLSAGVVVCAAAGNDGDTYGAPDNVDYPAACPAPWRNPDQTLEGGLSSVICVGAHDLDMSSRGPSTWEGTSYNDYPYNEGASMGLIRPDISAPGYYIYSLNYTANDLYAIKSGTSQATPCVAGVIALMLEKNSSLTPAQISQILEETAQSKPAKKNNIVGAGTVDALAAVNSITEVIGNPYVKLNKFTPATISTGNRTIAVTMKNEGDGPSDENTSVTLSLANDPYVTIINPTQEAGKIGAKDSKALYFDINVNPQTPSGHTIIFTVTTTSGNLSWENTFSVNVTTTPNLAFQSVSPGVVGTNERSEIKVSVINNGNAAFSDPITLNLLTLTGDLKYVDLIDTETTIPALGVGESGTGTFTIETKLPANKTSYSFDFFLETYSESTAPSSLVYEFENDLQGWTYFNPNGNSIKDPWNHNSKTIALTGEKDSHSGKGHLVSVTYIDGVAPNTTPIDNYLVSPVKIKVAENTKVSFHACANNDTFYEEHFGLAVSTTANTSASDFTTIQDWHITDTTTWKEYTADLSEYAGQEVYVAIRHFFTAQEWEVSDYGYNYAALNIDDIVFNGVILDTKHTSTLDGNDPYHFNVRANNSIYLPMVGTITATPMSGAMSLEWDAVNGVSKYGVYRNGQRVATVTDPVYVDEKLSYNKQYCYAVTTIASYESGFSEEVCATTLEPNTTPTPTNLAAMATSESTIDLLWDKVEEAASYNVYQGTELIASGITDTKYTVENLNAETNYCFVVTAVNVIGESDKSESACAKTLKKRPAAPIVTATADSESAITLTWDDVYGALSYKIYQDTKVIASGITKTTYTVTGLDAETEYCFYMTAVNETGASANSETACATTLEAPKAPAAPVVTATADDDTTITLTWDAVENATSYNVYTGTGTSTTLLASKITATTYTVQGLSPAKTYCFNVTAVNEVGKSESSATACATTHEKLTGIIVKSYELTAQTGDATLIATLINKCETAIPAGAKVTLSCNDNNISIVNETYDLLNAIAVNGTATATFTIEIAETVPANSNIEFNISVEYEKLVSGGTYNLSYTFDTDLDGCTAISKDTHNYPHNWYHSSECSDHKYNTRTYSELNKYNLSLSGEGFIFSESHCNNNNKGFKPDHWIILPEQIVPSDNTSLEFYVCALTSYTAYADETFGVFVSTTSNTDVNSFDPISNETLATTDKSRFWAKRTVKLSNYKDQKVWVAIRHYDTGIGNNSALAIDDITIANISTSSVETVTYEKTFTVTVNTIVNNTFNGTGSWGDNPNWSSGAPTEDDDVVIAGDVTINSGDVVVKSLTINNGYSLTVKSGTSLRVVEDFNNSDADAFIIEDGAQVFVNDDDVAATFNMNIINPESWYDNNKGGWQFISSPFNSSSITDFTGTGEELSYDLYKYNGTDENGLEWNNYKACEFEDTFVNGRGYLASYETAKIAALTGSLYDKDYFEFEEMTYYENIPLANFYLLGNPFTFNMDWSKAQAKGLVTGYAVVNETGGYDYFTTGTIPVGDGFFVKAIAENPSLYYNHNVRGSRQSDNNINVIATSKAGKDNVIINFAGQSEGFDKLQNFNKDIATVFVANNGRRYGIANVDENATEVELSFAASQIGNYSISIETEGEFETVTLVDRFTGIETNMLLEDEYNFTATSNDTQNRFVVRLVNGQQTTDNSQFVYQSGDELIVKAEGRIQIIDMMGRVVYTTDIVGEDNRINVSDFNKTAYVVRNINEKAVKTQKIVIF